NVIVFTLIALIGWRIGRRFGVRGQAIFVGTIAFISPAGDFVAAVHWFGIIKINESVLPALILMDFVAWGILSTVALTVRNSHGIHFRFHFLLTCNVGLVCHSRK